MENNCSLIKARTLKRKVKTNPASTTESASGGENSSNSSSPLSDQSGDTLPVYSSEEEDSAANVVTRPKRQIHEKQLQSDSNQDASDQEPLITPDHADGESAEEEAVGIFFS